MSVSRGGWDGRGAGNGPGRGNTAFSLAANLALAGHTGPSPSSSCRTILDGGAARSIAPTWLSRQRDVELIRSADDIQRIRDSTALVALTLALMVPLAVPFW